MFHRLLDTGDWVRSAPVSLGAFALTPAFGEIYMGRYWWCCFLLVAFVCFQSQAQTGQSENVTAQVVPTPSDEEENEPPTDETVGNSRATGAYLINILSDYEFWLSLAVLLFGVFVVILEYRLLLRTKAGPTSIIRVLAVTLILVGSLFLITAGFSSSQISPVSGLFGTIAGYLLGKVEARHDNNGQLTKTTLGEPKDV